MRAWIAVLAACGGGGGDPPLVDAGPCIDTAHDEDGDGVGDACDVCPAMADPRQLDTTELASMIAFADGVGDACDPRPRLSGDVLAALHTFRDPATAASWNGTGWSIADDRANASGTARWVHRTPEPGDGAFVQARFVRTGGSVEVVVDGDGVSTGYACRVDDASLYARAAGGATMMRTGAMPITGTITLSTWRVIDFQRRGELRCKVTSDAGTLALEMPTSDDLAVGLYGFARDGDAATEVSSVVVYTSPTLPEQDP